MQQLAHGLDYERILIQSHSICFDRLSPFLVPLVFVMPISSPFTLYYMLISASLILISMSFTGWLSALVKILLSLSCLASILSLVISGGFLATGAMHSILLTNPDEVTGYFQLIDWKIFLPTMMLTLGGLYCFWRTHIPLTNLAKAMASVFLLALLCALPLFKWVFDAEEKRLIQQDKMHLIYLYQDVPAYNLYRVASLTLYERFKSHIQYGNELPKHVQIDIVDTEDLPQNIVIVIGESSRRDAYSMYGNPIDASPQLMLRHKSQPNIFSVIDGVFAPAPNTRESVPRSFSFVSTDERLYQGLAYTNIINLARTMGYQTSWITTQALYTRWDSFTAKVATSAEQVFHKSEHGQPWHDRDAASKVSELLKHNQQPQFIVLHLSGEHADYAIRNGESVPSRHRQAIAQQVPDNALLSQAELSYFSSVHLTDTILDGLIKEVFADEQDSLFVYFSDHGEVIGKGHGLQPIQIEDELAIPYFAIGRLAKNMTRAIDCYRDNKHHLFNNAHFPEVLLTTLGMKVEPPKQVKHFTYYSIKGETRSLPDDFSFNFHYQKERQCEQ